MKYIDYVTEFLPRPFKVDPKGNETTQDDELRRLYATKDKRIPVYENFLEFFHRAHYVTFTDEVKHADDYFVIAVARKDEQEREYAEVFYTADEEITGIIARALSNTEMKNEKNPSIAIFHGNEKLVKTNAQTITSMSETALIGMLNPNKKTSNPR